MALRQRKEGKRVRFPAKVILGVVIGGFIRIRDHYSFDFDDKSGERIIKVLFTPGNDFYHNHREILVNTKKNRYGLYEWNVPERYFEIITDNPVIQKILITCDYPTNNPTLARKIAAKLVSRLNQKDATIEAQTEEINTLRAENSELAQGTTVQMILDLIKKLDEKYTELLMKEKAK